MKTGPLGLELIKRKESCELKAYQDIKKIWTIGWGHVDQTIGPGVVWTQQEADKYLVLDLGYAEHCIDTHVTVPLLQGEYDALVSLIFNIGCMAFTDSTLLRHLNNSDYDGAANQFVKWDHVEHVENKGLKKRRLEEQALFENTSYTIG